ncbi:MAG: hypothetical protein KGJ80_12875 [Chloroflexota bacterium]|nr:hypothetical protein [Chloroflexota bacterium]
MLPEFITETVAVIFMFIVRIGVPIAITLLVGRWLEKKLSPREEEQVETKSNYTTRVTRSGGKIIQMRCWDVKRCEPAKRAHCAAFQRRDLPCWLALQADGGKLRAECFTCAFYKPQSIAA